MEQRFIHRAGNERLLLFLAGWGADERLFDLPAAEGYDYLLCFDYRDLRFDASTLAPYRSVRLLGWSMGVWAATQVFGGLPIPWERRIALNGTPTPVDDQRGIPEAVFRGTLAGFSPATLARFRRRMCGSAEAVARFLAREPRRSVEELHEELAALERAVAQRPPQPFAWDLAVVGRNDRIFPAANQLRAWEGTPVREVAAEHYDETLFRACLRGEEERWTSC